jgi:hypothetical protein
MFHFNFVLAIYLAFAAPQLPVQATNHLSPREEKALQEWSEKQVVYPHPGHC